VRQPEIVRAGSLLLALVLAVPVVRGAERVVATTAFLIEFADPRATTLSSVTAPPVEAPRALPGVAADGYTPRRLAPPTPLVLVPGVTPDGKNDARARAAARLLARLGFDVTLPTVPGLTSGRLRPDDARPVVIALGAARRPAVIVSVSIGSGPALLAAADPRVRDRVALVVSLGGYASASELVRFYLTGAYRFGAEAGHQRHDPRLVAAFVAANADLLEPSARLDDILSALSPLRVAGDLRAPLILIHGRDDPTVPFTESLRMAAARPRGTSLVLLRTLGHVGAEGAGLDWRVAMRLWQAAYRLARVA
jgi:pimeloyl-ACP methyl ester carboxylesterase